jgi:hypothetical protein
MQIMATRTVTRANVSSQRRGEAHRSSSFLSLVPSTIEQHQETVTSVPVSEHRMAISRRLVKFRTAVLLKRAGHLTQLFSQSPLATHGTFEKC